MEYRSQINKLLLVLSIAGLQFACQTKSVNKPNSAQLSITSKKDSIDTVILSDFKIQNVVAYRLKYATIVVKQSDFEKKLRSLWQIYNDGMQDMASEKDRDFATTYTARFKALDSTLNFFKLVKKPNIIYLNHTYFEQFDFRPLMDFGDKIDSGTCAIFNEKGKRHFKIIKKLFSWYEGPRDAGGSRRYFIIAKKDFFYEELDWIS
ncbi:MAG: hypothetical protein EOO86_07360 [Pedobacter sp.]|nr:MAG: hypothetical protein EOO86_07360 [Pedobacter sp.]